MKPIFSGCECSVGMTREVEGEGDCSAKPIAERSSILTLPRSSIAAALLVGLLAGCSSPTKLTPQEAVIATEVTNEMNTTNAAVASSRYRTYRWLTPEEMTAHRLGYDPAMDPELRQEVEESIDDELANKGYQNGDPADFTVAFTDIYLDRDRTVPYTDIEIVRNSEEKFTVAFFDAQTGRVLWRGWGREALSGSQESDEQVALAVSHALEDMPVPFSP